MLAGLALILLAAQTTPLGEKAREFVRLLLAEKFEEVTARFSPAMQKAMPEATLKQAVAPFRQFGVLKETLTPELAQQGELEIVIVPVIFERMGVNIQVTYNQAGQVDGLFFRPRMGGASAAPWQPPAYSKPDSFRAEEATIGEEWKLPGTLLVPAGKGPHPAVVLVHGSGPNDRDETVGPNKPFRDLAEGLATRGIAVLRYDKRSNRYAGKLAALKEFTIDHETVEDAVLAAAALRSRGDIDLRRVFVLGHSLGGYAAPRIGARDAKLAGLIVLAGNTRPLEELLVDQTKYLQSLSPGDESSRKKLEELQQVAARIRALTKGGALAATDVVLGAPPSYWIDLKDYAPAPLARKLRMPILVLQGERDYQVTMADFAGWKEALTGVGTAKLKSYTALNHLFMAGQGMSTPAEYMKPGQHVAEELVGDIAAWIKEH